MSKNTNDVVGLAIVNDLEDLITKVQRLRNLHPSEYNTQLLDLVKATSASVVSLHFSKCAEEPINQSCGDEQAIRIYELIWTE